MDIFVKNNDWWIAFFHGLSAFQASLIVQLLHPFDVIKTRLQSYLVKFLLFFLYFYLRICILFLVCIKFTHFLLGHDGSQKNLVPKYSGISNAFKTIYVQEGLKGLYRGVAFTLVAQSLSSFLFFGL